jgi:hypothetical protein
MIAATFAGDVHAIDVGFAELVRPDGQREERAFVVMGGMGLDAAMIANTSGDLKKKVGWVAYVDGAARSLVKAKPFGIMYQVAGHRMHRAHVQSVLFANCGSLPAGLELIPRRRSPTGSSTSRSSNPRRPSAGSPCGAASPGTTACCAGSAPDGAFCGCAPGTTPSGTHAVPASRSPPASPRRCSSTGTSSARPRPSTRIHAGALRLAVPTGTPPTL